MSNSNLTKSPIRTFRAAVILSGCGVQDGSEITESASMLIALSKHNIQYQCQAPNKDQHHVINHTNGSEMPETRNVMVESARITRGSIQPLDQLDSANYDALFIPGGFGAAKNLSDFAVKGKDMEVDGQVEKVISDFYKSDKQLAMACISPIIAAKILGSNSTLNKSGSKITLGCKGESWPFSDSIDTAELFGNKLVQSEVDEVCYDQDSKIFTSPAQMKNDASPYQVFIGVSKLVDSVVNKLKGDSFDNIPISLIVHVTVKDESNIPLFLEKVKKNAQGSRLEKDCYRWDLLQDPEDKCKFVFFEVQKNKNAIEFHKSTDHQKGWDKIRNDGIATATGKYILNAIDYEI